MAVEQNTEARDMDREARGGVPFECGSGFQPRPPVAAETGDRAREARVGAPFECGSGFQPRFLSLFGHGRGKMPLPQSRITGCRLRSTAARFGFAVFFPSPVPRLPSTSIVGAPSRRDSSASSVGAGSPSHNREWRDAGFGRRGVERAPRAAVGRGWKPLPQSGSLSRLPSTSIVGAASSRDSSALGRGRMPLPQIRVAGCSLRCTAARALSRMWEASAALRNPKSEI